MADRPELNEDFLDLLHAFVDAGVEFLVVGAHALAAHGVVRATGDLDVFVSPTATNADRVVAGLRAFGAPLSVHGVSRDDFAKPGTVYQLGLPPRRIDIITAISGVDFEQAAREAMTVVMGSIALRVPGRAALLANKRASGRPKDLEDASRLEQLEHDPPIE
jgi:hypothetical protein